MEEKVAMEVHRRLLYHHPAKEVVTQMVRLIDVSFAMDSHFRDPATVVDVHKPGHGYAYFAEKELDITVIEHINYEGDYTDQGVKYRFFKGSNSFWHLPLSTIRYIRSQRPDVVLLEGLIFPFQVILLRMFLNRRTKFIVQHHGESVRSNYKQYFQRIANKYVDKYLFTTIGNAEEWIKHKVIRRDKCVEVLEASTFFTQKDKQQCRQALGFPGGDIFLWVGRLERGKDPLTILSGFESYLADGNIASLYMIYQEEDQIKEVQAEIAGSDVLRNSVNLVGKVDHKNLECWFSAADYFLAGSHKEAAGYALLEAMACGCIPVVSDIPPFVKILGGTGFTYKTGDANSLAAALSQLSKSSKEQLQKAVLEQFKSALSFQKIADDILRVCTELTVQPQ